MKTLWRLPLFVLLSFAIACSSSPDKDDKSLTEESGPIPRYLELIPASTPYVFGALDPVPEPIALEQFAALDRAISASIEGLPDDAELSYMNPEERFITEFAREVRGKLSTEAGLAELGLSSSPRFVVYGIGPFPVFRLEIADGSKLIATIDKVAKTSGLQLAVQTLQEVEYRSYISDDAQISIAVIGNEAVMTVTEIDAASIVVPYALGIKKPESSMASDNQLEKAAEKYGFQRHGVGFTNVVETAAMLSGGGSALNAAAFSVVDDGGEPVPQACRDELGEYAAAMPRLVMGLESLTVDTVSVKFAAEFTNDLPKRLKAAKRPIPGWTTTAIDAKTKTPISIGIGAHVGSLLDIARVELREARDRAYACQDFQSIPTSAGEMLAMTQFIPPVVSDLTGARAAFLGMRENQGGDDAASQPMISPRLVDAWVVLRTPDPQSLFSTVRTFAPPEIQSLQVQPNGEPVEIPMGEGGGYPFESLKMMMTETAIGVTTSDSLLPQTQKVANEALAEGAPMIAVAFDIGAVMGSVMGPMAPPSESNGAEPIVVTVDPTDTAILTTVRVPFKALMGAGL